MQLVNLFHHLVDANVLKFKGEKEIHDKNNKNGVAWDSMGWGRESRSADQDDFSQFHALHRKMVVEIYSNSKIYFWNKRSSPIDSMINMVWFGICFRVYSQKAQSKSSPLITVANMHFCLPKPGDMVPKTIPGSKWCFPEPLDRLSVDWHRSKRCIFMGNNTKDDFLLTSKTVR